MQLLKLHYALTSSGPESFLKGVI